MGRRITERRKVVIALTSHHVLRALENDPTESHPPMNTRIHYLYRDGANNKQDHEEVLAGTFTTAQVVTMRAACEDARYFIPGDVGLPEIQTCWRDQGYAYPTDNDHVWCEFSDPEPTDAPPTLDMTANAFYQRWMAIKVWDVAGAQRRLGLDSFAHEMPPVH